MSKKNLLCGVNHFRGSGERSNKREKKQKKLQLLYSQTERYLNCCSHFKISLAVSNFSFANRWYHLIHLDRSDDRIHVFLAHTGAPNGEYGVEEQFSCYQKQSLLRDEQWGVTYSYTFFHIIFILATLHIMMQLTNWYRYALCLSECLKKSKLNSPSRKNTF